MSADGGIAGSVVISDDRAARLIARLGAGVLDLPPQGGRDALARRIAGATDGRLDPEQVDAMLADPVFGTRLRRYAAADGRFDGFDDAAVERLWTRPESRLAVLVVTAGDEDLALATTCAAAAILQKRFVRAVTRDARARLGEAFGPEAAAFACGEAPVLYPALAELEPESFEPSADAVRRLGLQALQAFVESTEPALGVVFMHRFGEIGRDLVDAAGFSAGHGRLIHKCLLRKIPEWTALVS